MQVDIYSYICSQLLYKSHKVIVYEAKCSNNHALAWMTHYEASETNTGISQRTYKD